MAATATTPITLRLSKEASAALEARAAAAKMDLASYVTNLVEQNARLPLSLAQISGPVAAEFEASGLTEDELSEALEQAKHAMRNERRARRAS